MTAWSFAACGLVAACASGPMTVRTAGAARTARGERVRIEGTAEDAKLGAVLVGADGLVVYLADQSSWPAELLGHRVVAEGVLEAMDAPPATTSPEPSAGLTGTAFRLRGAAYHVVP